MCHDGMLTCANKHADKLETGRLVVWTVGLDLSMAADAAVISLHLSTSAALL